MALYNDWIGLGLFFGFLVLIGLPVVLLKVCFNVPFELIRKMYHMVITLSIFPLVKLFSAWYMAVLAAFLLVLIAYPLLTWWKNPRFTGGSRSSAKAAKFKKSHHRAAVDRADDLRLWGLLGSEWKYVAVVAVMAWGFGDAAAH
jgi:hypothetical protein